MSLIVILFSILQLPLSSSDVCNMDEIRMTFHQAVLDECQIDNFYALAMEIDAASNPVALSYKAAGYVMKAKDTWNPIENIKLALTYRKKIDEAVLSDPVNVEIRFLRFSIAYYLPDIMGFKKNMWIDKRVIMKNLCQFDIEDIHPEFYRFILWFVENSGYFTDYELSLMTDYLSLPNS